MDLKIASQKRYDLREKKIQRDLKDCNDQTGKILFRFATLISLCSLALFKGRSLNLHTPSWDG